MTVSKEISGRFSYFGGYPEPVYHHYIEIFIGLVIANLLFWFFLALKGEVSRFVFLFLGIITIGPVLTLNSLNPHPQIELTIGVLSFSLVALLGLYLTRNVRFSGDVALPSTIFLSLSFVSIAISLLFFKSHSFGVVISDIYETRQNMRDSVPFPGAERFYYYASRFAIVFLICHGVIYRRSLLLCAGLASAILLFLIGGHKSILVLCLMALLISFLLRLRYTDIKIILCILAVLVVSICLDILIDSRFLTDFFIRRIIILPANLHYYYFEQFFTDPNWFRVSPLNDADIPFAISEIYFNRSWMRANSSVISSSVTSLGIFSVISQAFIFGVMLGIIDRFVEKIRVRSLKVTLTAVCFCFSWSFTESALFVVLFTHGLVLLFLPWLLSFMMNKTRW